MKLYLIRHGQGLVNLQESAPTSTDEGLTPLGRRQAIALARTLPHEVPTVDGFFCSTLKRARETAAILAQAYPGCSIQYDDRLRELGNNRADHTPFPDKDFVREFATVQPTDQPFVSGLLNHEQGEAWVHFKDRVGAFIEELAASYQDRVILVVCHGGVIEAVFNHVFNVGPWTPCEMWEHIQNTGVTCFESVERKNGRTWRLHYHNRVGHLDNPS